MFSGVLSGSGRKQESGETSGGKPNAISGESKGVGPGGSGVQTGVGGSPGAQARVTRGYESTRLRGLTKGPRNAFLEGKKDGDG